MFGRGRAKVLAITGACAVAAALATTVAAPAGAAAPPTPVQVCLAPGGAQPDQRSDPAALSADGRYALIDSLAGNLTPQGGNGGVFVCDLRTGHIEQADLSESGSLPDSYSSGGALSADGRYAVFTSAADNLAPGATKGVQNVYLRDLRTHRTQLISAGNGSAPQVGDSDQPTISADGRYIAYTSNRPDLVPGGTGTFADVFVYDRHTGSTVRASVHSDGSPAVNGSVEPSISADGSRVTFISRDPSLASASASASASTAGQTLVPHRARFYPLYVHDLRTGRTSLASIEPDGSTAAVSQGVLSADGRYAVFTSLDNDFLAPSQIMVRDLDRGTTTLVSTAPGGAQGDQDSLTIGMSADDRSVFFTSSADNLLPGSTAQAFGYYRHDLRTNSTERLLQLPDPASGGQGLPAAVDGRGNTLLFGADGSRLLPGDTNQSPEAFALQLPRR
ncbi:PD40 domain-containing protein [Kitasatospora kifunensis]|uniref:Tol biopolymer transport system component n=1 Tax=Kitasatospora kifunensis TaxID=58351 RepID=A0A7W7QWY4_KITKI|nr:PD40 domain-containing protein [Kitasatospora kifunensis]MBB4921262.1 Tol biopolymer transport system component [Kitasatospora kifunensis]